MSWLAQPLAATRVSGPRPLTTRPATTRPDVSLDDDVPVPADDDPDRDRILRLQETVNSIVHGPMLARTRVGIRIIDARTGRPFYSRQSTTLMDPASNQKVLATAAALLRLGNAYCFLTELRGAAPDVDRVVQGDVVLRGSSDPSLHIDDINAMADTVVARGVQRITGGVIADRRRLGEETPTENAKSPLHVRGAAVIIRVHPSDRVGRRPVVTVSPRGDMLVIHNRAQTRPRGRSRIRVQIGQAGGRIVVNVSGTIARNHPGVVLRRQPGFSMLYAATLLRQALVDRGVQVDGPARIGIPATSDRDEMALLAAHQSQPLPILMRPINKHSNNDYADRLLEVLGAEVYGGTPSMAKGVRALRDAMDDLGIYAASYVPVNGSGLGHRNRVTARAVVDLLRALYHDPRIGPEVVQSLSVGGVDGTTRNRFLNSPAAHLVRAKTGTLNGKSILSGYVGEGSDVLIFSILVDRIRGRSVVSVRNAQVRIVESLMSYLHGVTGETPADVLDPGVDYETGEEEMETEEELPAGTPPPPEMDTAEGRT